MRIVIVANNIEELGGAQRVAHTLARAWGQRGHSVDLVGVTPHRSRHHYEIDGYRTHTLMSGIWPAKAEGPLTADQKNSRATLRAEAVRGLAHILAGEPGLLVVTQVWGMEMLNDPSLDEHRRTWRIIGQYHGSFAAAASGRDLVRLTRAYRAVDRMVALTDEDAAAFIRAGLPCEVMPNPLSEWPDTVPTERPRMITYLGRLSYEKGPDILARAWELVHEQAPDWSVQFVGNGSETLHDLPRMSVVPAVADPTPIFRTTSLLALPSRTEGLPMALAEAQSWGIPAVATDCSSGVRELMGGLEHPHGFLVAPENPEAFAQALLQATTSVARTEYGERARMAMRAYRLDPVMSRWDDLVERIQH